MSGALALMMGVGGREIVRVGVSTVAGATHSSSLIITKPSGVLAGDLLLAIITCDDGSTWSGDTGWSEVRDSSGFRIAIKTATGSEGSSFAFTASGSTDSCGVIIAYRDAAFDVVGSVTLAALGDDNVASSITLSAKGLLIAAFAINQPSRTMSTPSGMLPVVIDANATIPSLAVFSQQLGAGATGTRTSSPGGGGISAGILIGIKGA